MIHKRIVIVIATVASVAAVGLPAADWPGYRGPDRNDLSRETGLLKAWPAGGPRLLWTFDNAGAGLSGVAVVGGRLYTLGARDGVEYVYALDLAGSADGKVRELWAAKVGPMFQWKGNSWNAGPSSTPTVDGDVLYALGGQGELVCVELAAGKQRWRKSLPTELAAEINPVGGGPARLGWGFTWSPLVDGDRLICQPGGKKGTLAALDKKTGAVLWQTAGFTDQASYASPVVAEFGGVRQYVQLTNQGLTGVGVDGKVLWRHARRFGTEVINTPIVFDKFVYASVGAGNACVLVKVDGKDGAFAAEAVYDNKNLLNHHGGTLMFDGRIYGFAGGRGWTCQDARTGEVVWAERGRLGEGSITYADGRLYCFGEGDGTAVLVEAGPGGWKESGRLTIPKKSPSRARGAPLERCRIWTPPVVADGKLFLRDQELLYCYEVKGKP
jgi:outer membrane protein assembly factor BamB